MPSESGNSVRRSIRKGRRRDGLIHRSRTAEEHGGIHVVLTVAKAEHSSPSSSHHQRSLKTVERKVADARELFACKGASRLW